MDTRAARIRSVLMLFVITLSGMKVSAGAPEGTRSDPDRASLVVQNDQAGDRKRVKGFAPASISDAAIEAFQVRVLDRTAEGSVWLSGSERSLRHLAESRLVMIWRPAAVDKLDGALHKRPSDDADVSVVVDIRLHADVPRWTAAKELAARHRMIVLDVAEVSGIIHAVVDEASLVNLAREDIVRSVHKALPAMNASVNAIRHVTGVEPLFDASTGSGYDGRGVSVLVIDRDRPRDGHAAFGGRLVNLDVNDPPGGGLHSTPVAGIIGGSGAASFGQTYRGMAPGVQMYWRLNNAGNQLATNPCDIESDLLDAVARGATLCNVSLNAVVCETGQTHQFGRYDCTAVVVDGIIRTGSVGDAAPAVVWSAGNFGAGGPFCMDGFGSISPPAAAKNITTVGSVNATTLSIVPTSSRGPTLDGRLKPELVAPGEQSGAVVGAAAGGPDVGGVFNNVSTPRMTSDTAYGAGFNGTSAAAPVVTGIYALLYQGYRDMFGPDATMQPAILKALACHTALDLGLPSNAGPDHRYGYGLIQADAAIQALIGNAWIDDYLPPLNEELDPSSRMYTVSVPPGLDEFKVTLAWDDVPGEVCYDNCVTCETLDVGRGSGPPACTTPRLVNDLDLTIISPDQATVWGSWIIPTAVGSAGNPSMRQSASTESGLVRDIRNNIEQVSILNPVAGEYTIKVAANALTMDGQRFALVATPGPACGETVALYFERSAFTSDSVAWITLRACEENVSPTTVDSTTVTVRRVGTMSTTNVSLTETGADTGVFRGLVDLSQLALSHDDEIEVSYVSMSSFAESVAIIDDVPPTVSYASVVADGATRVIVSFVSDELVTAEVDVGYGTCMAPQRIVRAPDPGNPVESGSPPILEYVHEFAVDGLAPSELITARIRVRDYAGNEVIVTDSGNCFEAVTSSSDVFLTERFTSSGSGQAGDQSEPGPRPFDLEFMSIEFYPITDCRGGEYAIISRDIDELPVDPSGGTPLFEESVSNDVYHKLSVPGNSLFSFFGNAYEDIFVGSNGYITFGAGDTSSAATVTNHFSAPRISALIADFDVRRGGTISYKYLVDRLVITWMNVPRQSQSDASTFQVQLFTDGRIVLSWLDCAVESTVVGLSPPSTRAAGRTAVGGRGVPTGFQSTDLSAVRSEGLFPPVAQSEIVSIPQGTSAHIGLAASDDGDPGLGLTYTILSLPHSSVGTLVDVGASPPVTITTVPYDLAGFGYTVRFVPASAMASGETAFQFVANDGGEGCPPDVLRGLSDPTPNGGVSAPATILLRVGRQEMIWSALRTDALDPSGWTGFSQNGWAFGPAAATGPSGPYPDGAVTGVNVIAYALAGDYPPDMPSPDSLTTPAIDCSDVSGTVLRFWRWLSIDSGLSDQAEVSVSNDGVSWTPVWTNPLSVEPLKDRQWRLREYDISKVADHQATVYIRWSIGPTDDLYEADGWNLDDIVVSGFRDGPCCPGDLNGSNSVNFSDLALILGNLGVMEAPSPYDINGDGVADMQDVQIVLSNFGINCTGCN